MFIDSGPSEGNRYLGGTKFSWGFTGVVRPPVGVQGAKPLKRCEISRCSTLKTNFFLVPNCMGFEQLKYSHPQQSPEKHKLISHSKQEDKKPLRSYQLVVQRITWLYMCLLFVQF